MTPPPGDWVGKQSYQKSRRQGSRRRVKQCARSGSLRSRSASSESWTSVPPARDRRRKFSRLRECASAVRPDANRTVKSKATHRKRERSRSCGSSSSSSSRSASSETWTPVPTAPDRSRKLASAMRPDASRTVKSKATHRKRDRSRSCGSSSSSSSGSHNRSKKRKTQREACKAGHHDDATDGAESVGSAVAASTS